MFQDLRYSARQLRRSPGFTLVALLSLALGLGANTTIFTVTNALLLQPMRVARPDEMVRVYNRHHSPFNYTDYRWFRDRTTTLAALVGERMMAAAMVAGGGSSDGGAPERVSASLVSADMFRALGLRPSAGRLTFTAADDDAPGAVSEVVLSHAFWTSRFGADPALVGRTLQLNGRPFTVVGVGPAGFTSSVYGWRVDCWVPFAEAEALVGARARDFGGSLYLTGRLEPGVSRDAAAGELRVLMGRLAADEPEGHQQMTVRVDQARGLNAELRGPAAAGTAFLLAVVGTVLLIACANVANLLLARNAGRRREIGVRLALGASRARIVTQLLTESALPAGAGGALALLLTLWTSALLERVVPADLPLTFDFSPDRGVLAFAVALCAVTSVLFGLAPALRASSPDLLSTIKDDSAQGGTRRTRMRGALLTAQVALCTVLLTGASLFLHSLRNARAMDAGFDTTGLLDVHVDLSTRRMSREQGGAFYRRLVERATETPGVGSAALAALVPLGGSNMETTFYVAGEPAPGTDAPRPRTYFNIIGPRYFETMHIPLVQGREFADADREQAPRVAIVNETMAARRWPGESPLGKRVSIEGPGGPFAEVVGVARDVRYNSLGETTPAFLYLPLEQLYRDEMVLHVRAREGAAAPQVGRAVASALRAMDPALPPAVVKTIGEDQSVALIPARIAAVLLGAFGTLALLLASVGIYGVTSYAVAQRTREIGVRTALGARARDVLAAVLGDAMRRVGVGAAVGLALGLVVSRLLQAQLYGVRVLDPATFIATPMALAATALVAAFVPAWRAVGVDPVVALRAE